MDIKAIDIERKTKRCRTAMEVYESIPMIAPTITSMVTRIDTDLGQYLLPSLEEYLQILIWNRTDILSKVCHHGRIR